MKRHDLLDDAVFQKLLKEAMTGMFHVGVFGIPCSTFSVARINNESSQEGGPKPVRNREPTNRMGLTGLNENQLREVQNANLLMLRSIELATAICQHGGQVIFENPVDRGNHDSHDSVVRDRHDPAWAQHAPLWTMPAMVAMRTLLGLQEVTFAQCRMGGDFQKWTTL